MEMTRPHIKGGLKQQKANNTMTTAEKLRAKMAKSFPFTEDEFINIIAKKIEWRGYASFLCDRHIAETLDYCIAMRDEETAKKIATSEGFDWHYEYNSYGVRKIVFTL